MDNLRQIADNGALLLLSRVIQLVGIPLGLAAMTWFGSTMNTMQLTVEQLKTQMEERTQDRYTGTDAKHDLAIFDVEFKDLERRVNALEDLADADRGLYPPPAPRNNLRR